jgi:hypothetical protein
MCCNNCKEITLFKGTDGVGISSIVANNNGTLTFYYTNGTSYTSPVLTGPQGSQGPAGNNGTNAFKFVKEYTDVNLEEFGIEITQAELTSCGPVPQGCLFDNISSSISDIHVQVWIKDPALTYWYRLFDVNQVVAVFTTSGNISIAFQGTIGTGMTVRVVILA